ncbi:hypothetical protein ZWY2020_027647 [Hordeum vulgare]|nr:hypothetical protein ZWY2020_027647 [Hordeum vulgare]
MPPAPAALLLAAPAGLSLGLAPWRPRARAPPRLRLRAARIRAAATVNGVFGGLGRRRLDAGEFIGRLRNVLPGGSWWRLEDDEAGGAGRAEASGATAASALRRMWALVAADRWVIFAGFASSSAPRLGDRYPHLLAASIFSAQNGGAVFYRNAKLLVVLCLISGVFSSLPFAVAHGCCFGIANMILVKRMREMLFDSILSQDIAFFDEETVGDLTSRLGSDCQQVSRVIGNDLNLISRNLLQGIGALIYLLILSWPLGLCTMLTCGTLSTIMLVHGRYQKKASKFAQEFTASANNVAQEAISLVRTVRVYGTEKQEIKRYTKWLDKLYDVSFRQTMAYGGWSLSLNYLYHSTQLCVGPCSFDWRNSNHEWKFTAEQLTKFTLYAEWLILSTWWIGDNWSSLMQSVGASEKSSVDGSSFSKQLTSKGKTAFNLTPSFKSVLGYFNWEDVHLFGSLKHFILAGLRLQKLEGRIQYANVEFSYPSRPSAPILRRLNLTLNPNEVVAIVGLSGSGKSTIVNLLLQLYEPTNGQILIDGVPPASLTLDGSGKELVLWDRSLSYSEWMLVLILTTSALDAESEHYVKSVITEVSTDPKARRTVIIIAHRLSTIQAADRIIVMENGSIVEDGKHSELVKQNGLYSRLAQRQNDALP